MIGRADETERSSDWLSIADLYIYIYKKRHNEGAILPLLSSDRLFCLTPAIFFFFFFQRRAPTQNCRVFPLMKALAVLLSLASPRGVDDQHQLRLRRTEVFLCVAFGGVQGRDPTCLLFCSYALTPSSLRRAPVLTNPPVRGIRTLSQFSCTLNAVRDRLCFLLF